MEKPKEKKKTMSEHQFKKRIELKKRLSRLRTHKVMDKNGIPATMFFPDKYRIDPKNGQVVNPDRKRDSNGWRIRMSKKERIRLRKVH
jgi:hypothetical protein